MQLANLVYWKLEGTPAVFKERKDGHEWFVIDSDKAYTAGFSQVVYFDKLVTTVSISVVASLYTTGGGLMLRLGVHPSGLAPLWSGWYGPDNGWDGQKAQVLRFVARDLDTYSINVTLEGRAPSAPRWPGKNICRWRDVQLEVEYGGDPEPPDPEPEPEPGIPGQIAQLQAEITELYEQVSTRLTKIDALIVQWNQAQVWIDVYNASLDG